MDPQGGIENRAWKARVLTSPKCLADVSVSENHVWSLLLHKVSLENVGKTHSKDLRHHNVTKLRSFLSTLLLMASIFVTT